MPLGPTHNAVFRSQRQTAVALVVAVLLGGTLAYRFLAGPGWSWLDALYMTVISVATVGYQEVHPLDTGGRLVTIVVILAGLGVIGFITATTAENLIRAGTFWRMRVLRSIDRLEGHIVVCGYGRVGRSICAQLRAHGIPHCAISLEEPPEVEDDKELILVGDATDDAVLEKAGVRRARGIVSVLRSDADNIYAVLAARALNPALFIMSRCGEERSASKLRAAGAHRVINPYDRGGWLMAQMLMRPQVVDFADRLLGFDRLGVSLEQADVGAGSALDGVTLRESPIRRDLDIIVTAVERRDGSQVFNPSPDYRIAVGDTLIVLGRGAAIDRLRTLCAAPA